ncbi:BCLAF1 and THRAP3 family member 3 isoform X2 [Scophthalmus maximus]|uniref:BCLAF1 and THRAP3 family member 3 isoform X2 n=1 Tax=Scophthalmus maximus TaxID=52904 RepID=UPI001FA938EE|nr:BCLAF1 and THRAP3 family member 3 isoform X2 [Scophthalmus maximus]
MSRPRTRSPHYRRFPWEESNFDPHKVLTEPGGNPQDRSHRLRQAPEEHWSYARGHLYPEDRRRSPSGPDEQQPGHQRRPDEGESYHRMPSPRYDAMGLGDRRLSPPRNVGGDRGRRRGEGFREHFQSFDNRGRSPRSPPKVVRERLPQTPKSHADQQQREPATSWRDQQGRSEGKFRGLSPPARDDQRGAAGRGRARRNEQGPNRERRREGPLQERSPPFKRQRRDVDDSDHLGYRNEEDYGGQRYSADSPRDGFGGDTQGDVPRGDTRPVRPLVIEHDHGNAEGRKRPQREQQVVDRRDVDLSQRQRSPRPLCSSQERFRTPHGRPDDREDPRGRHFQDNWRDSNYVESKRSPAPQERPNAVRYANREGPVNHRGRGGPGPVRGRLNRGLGGRTGPLRNQPRLQQGHQDLPREEQRPGYRPFRGDCFADPIEGGANWAGEDRLQQWDHDRPRSLDRHPPRDGLDPKMPRQRPRGWNEKNATDMTPVKEETLTIKVDMTQPVNQNSSLCYSSDRQLSLDLVNVGRQRLDFLPMLEHSGTYQETAVHTGTFAQEIITLVHHVKEHYFRDDGLTLNERFSAAQRGSVSEEEVAELTLDERFSSNRGFSLNTNSLLDDDDDADDDDDDDEPLFSRPGGMQLLLWRQGLNQPPVRGPGDLRHDLERRRQERLEGVKVTIAGKGIAQRPLGPISESGFQLSDDQAEGECFSAWTDEQSGRRDGNMVQRRGALFRANTGSQRRNNRFNNNNNNNRVGAMRRQNNRGGSSNNPAGPNW